MCNSVLKISWQCDIDIPKATMGAKRKDHHRLHHSGNLSLYSKFNWRPGISANTIVPSSFYCCVFTAELHNLRPHWQKSSGLVFSEKQLTGTECPVAQICLLSFMELILYLIWYTPNTGVLAANVMFYFPEHGDLNLLCQRHGHKLYCFLPRYQCRESYFQNVTYYILLFTCVILSVQRNV